MKRLFARMVLNTDRVQRGSRVLAGLALLLLLSNCAMVTNDQAATAYNARGIAMVPLLDGSTRIDIATDAAFDFGSAALRPAFAAQMVTVLKPYLQHSVRVSGYTDNVGARAFNLDLSKRRARAVADVLREQGFTAAQLVVSGYGEDNPGASNATEAGRRLNRRIELLISAQVPG